MWLLSQVVFLVALGGTPPVAAQRVHLTLSGWTIVESSREMTLWEDEGGDRVSVAEDHHPLPPLDEAGLRRFCRKIAEGRGGGLIEVAVVNGPQGQGVRFIYKRPEGLGFAFTGMLVTADQVLTVVAREHGTTGVREAAVTTQLINAGKLTVEDAVPGLPSYEKVWARDPYDAGYDGVKRTTLRYMSDDESYDAQFPLHPLSKVRRLLRELPEHIVFDAPASTSR
jgi:hypothetical protein